MSIIRETRVGSMLQATLLVKSAVIKKTGAGKPYLFMELTDGVETVAAQDWDYGDKAPPIQNEILEVNGTVGEWQGKKQIKINSFFVNTTISPEQFAPKGDMDFQVYVALCNDLRAEIKHPIIRDIVDRVFKDNSNLWKTVPAAKGIHHAFIGGNLKHSVDVALKAKAMAELIPGCNKDLCIAGGLLQDFGKLWTYELNGAVIDMSHQGMMMEHIAIGIAKLETYRTPENSAVLNLLQHLIASHHGLIEYGATATPLFIEAWVVHICDMLDAKVQTALELNAKAAPDAIFTEKSYALENRPQFTQHYINSLLEV